MTIAVLADDFQWEELTKDNDMIDWVRLNTYDQFEPNAGLYVVLKDIEAFLSFKKEVPTIIDAVEITLEELNAGDGVTRLNGWHGFLSRNNWEMAGKSNAVLQNFVATIGKKITWVPDVPGFIAARTIAMIINEAYLALEEGVSSKEDIDIAMKLGTNYPLGPFEWAEKISIRRIELLLNKLSKNDISYTPAKLLLKESLQ